MEIILEKNSFPTLMQEEIENLNSPMTITWIELIISHPIKKTVGPRGYNGVF